jgi:DNA-binding beta-propeller fold protein YncE
MPLRNLGTLAIIDTASDLAVKWITVGAEPTGVTFAPDGTRAYVANYSGDSI